MKGLREEGRKREANTLFFIFFDETEEFIGEIKGVQRVTMVVF
jgi:hypothetical protein